jgi:hypothetical protein
MTNPDFFDFLLARQDCQNKNLFLMDAKSSSAIDSWAGK